MKTIILASESERRIKMLKDINIEFKTVPSTFDEPGFEDLDLSPAEYALYNAEQKAKQVAQNQKNSLVIGMDTIGEHKGRVLEKPKNRDDAKDMIHFLSGTTHKVITGVCIIDSDSGHKVAATEITKVTFSYISDNEIEKYLELGAWKGLAAGYAIQGIGALFVEKIEGDFFNVVGFPVFRFSRLMKEIGVNMLELVNKKKAK